MTSLQRVPLQLSFNAATLVKRLLGLVFSALGLVLCAPLLAGVAFVVWITMGRPVLFQQRRPGLDARPFTLYKFRTMRTGGGSDVERLTPTGRWLRRWSLDELPQLFNVLRGDMSLVGPRPLLMEYLEVYTPTQSERHDVKPGITGWAQIHGRNALSWPRRLALDVWYARHRTLRLDFYIFFCTVVQVIRGRGVSQEGHATVASLTKEYPAPTSRPPLPENPAEDDKAETNFDTSSPTTPAG